MAIGFADPVEVDVAHPVSTTADSRQAIERFIQVPLYLAERSQPATSGRWRQWARHIFSGNCRHMPPCRIKPMIVISSYVVADRRFRNLRAILVIVTGATLQRVPALADETLRAGPAALATTGQTLRRRLHRRYRLHFRSMQDNGTRRSTPIVRHHRSQQTSPGPCPSRRRCRHIGTYRHLHRRTAHAFPMWLL